MNDAIKAVLKVARGEVGVRENRENGHYTNRGIQVDKYQQTDNLPGVGYAYCCSFDGWGIYTALGEELRDRVWLPTASCDLLLAWARRNDIFSHTPEPGCAGLVMASEHDATHAFMVEDVISRNVHTIEANTNIDGSREGNGVYARIRPISSRLGFVHWAKLLPAVYTLPGQVPTPDPKPVPNSPFNNAPFIELWFGVRKVETLPVVQGRAWLPAWKWAKWMRAELGWSLEAQAVMIAGREVPAQPILFEGRAWLPVRKLVEFSGLKVVSQPGKVMVSQ